MGDTESWKDLRESSALWELNAEKQGKKWEPDEFFRTGREQIAKLWERLDSLRLLPPGDTALDFGCGVGRLTQPLADKFTSVVGLDVSEKVIELAKTHNHYPHQVSYRVNSKPELSDFPSGHFDFVLSLSVLQHLPPDLSVSYLCEFLRVVKPGGILIFQLTTPKRLRKPLKDRIQALLPPALKRLARRVGKTDRIVVPMYGVPRLTVEHLLSHTRVNFTRIEPDQAAGPDWESYTYYVRR